MDNESLPYPPRLTKYEKAKMIAIRAKQLAMGATPLIDAKSMGLQDPIQIAIEELNAGKLPFIVVRSLPNGKRREYTIDELNKMEDSLI
ncbi:MAG: hypothetical protein AT710_06270 [Thermocladium sp. ECH_B]|jgi:DNA-directed RNA polymerase subunit K|nr:MAG: hypothetical protein AT710_06270 [Thermocladium sp. ECH_B]